MIRGMMQIEMNAMPKYLVKITDYNDGEVYDEFIIANPDALIDFIELPIVKGA